MTTTTTTVATEYRFARRITSIKTSAIREILKITERPEIISFAGGLPAPELFPVEEFAEAHAAVFREEGQAALQYSTTEGWLPLRTWIAEHLRAKGIAADPSRILITAGSQQGIDLVARTFVDSGDKLIVENPTYLAAIQTFAAAEASLVGVRSDECGICVEDVERAIVEHKSKLIYLVPDFHNPTGVSLSLDRRFKLVELAARHRVPIIEDDPYGDLRFDGDEMPRLAAIGALENVIYLGTFSKTLSPGLRIGWIAAPEAVFRAAVKIKQAADLHTSTISQRAAARLLGKYDYSGHLGQIRRVYGERCHAMIDALNSFFPSSTRWTRPGGGLFLWVELPAGVVAEHLLEEAIAQKVAFVPGSPFFVSKPANDFIRLNFSNCPVERIKEGIAILGGILKRRTR